MTRRSAPPSRPSAGGGRAQACAGEARALVWEAALDRTRPFRPGPGGLVVTCRIGTFLVTQEGDPEDHVLEPGGSFRTAGAGLVVAWALRAGVLEVADARDARAPARAAGDRAGRDEVPEVRPDPA